jgi:hypothetical protein
MTHPIRLCYLRGTAADPGIGIDFEVDGDRIVEIDFSIHNSSGERVRHLGKELCPPGPHRISWDGRDDDGQPLPAGVYICRLAGSYQVETGTFFVRPVTSNDAAA